MAINMSLRCRVNSTDCSSESQSCECYASRYLRVMAMMSYDIHNRFPFILTEIFLASFQRCFANDFPANLRSFAAFMSLGADVRTCLMCVGTS